MEIKITKKVKKVKSAKCGDCFYNGGCFISLKSCPYLKPIILDSDDQ